LNGNLAWASEGDRTLTSTPARVINPFIREITKAGQHVREYDLPADQFTVKGATEMLALSATQFLVLERSFFCCANCGKCPVRDRGHSASSEWQTFAGGHCGR